MGQVIAVANQKGGVGKTTTVVTLATLLSRVGKRVLVIDADSQGNASTNLGHDPKALDEEGRTLAFLLQDERPSGEVVQEGEPALVAAWESLDAVEGVGPGALREVISSLLPFYDLILIDCAPTLTRTTAAALVAADYILIPTDLSIESASGLGRILRTVGEVRERANPRLQILGVLPTRYNAHYSHDRQVLEELKESLEPRVRVFTPIMNTTQVQKAARVGEAVVDFDRRSGAAEHYQDLANYILNHV